MGIGLDAMHARLGQIRLGIGVRATRMQGFYFARRLTDQLGVAPQETTDKNGGADHLMVTRFQGNDGVGIEAQLFGHLIHSETQPRARARQACARRIAIGLL